MRVILKSPCGREFKIAPLTREEFEKLGSDAPYTAPNRACLHSTMPRSAYDHYKFSRGYHEWKDFSIEWLNEMQIVITATEEEFLN
jgi:hypothetical protein